jgi:hypothetical protein
MGSLTPLMGTIVGPGLTALGVPPPLVAAISAFNAFTSYQQTHKEQKNAQSQLQAQQKLNEQMAQEQADLQKQQMAVEAEAAEKRRVAALRRAVARQKTLFSAQGLSAYDSGSSEAVLLGLYDDSATEGDQQKQLTGLRNAALDQSLKQQKQKNILEASQLAERNRFSRIVSGA